MRARANRIHGFVPRETIFDKAASPSAIGRPFPVVGQDAPDEAGLQYSGGSFKGPRRYGSPMCAEA